MPETFRDTLRETAGHLNDNAGCFVIGEVAQAHDGSLGTAHAFVDAIADAGADAVKFQTHIASAESTPGEPWRVKFSYQDASRFDYWKRMEFTEDQWRGLQEHAVERGLVFLSSPFSTAAVDLLTRVGVHAWKIASGEVFDPTMFDAMSASRLPFIVSTGMSTWEEIDAIAARLAETSVPYALLQCTSAYPCPLERVGLNVIEEMRSRYRCFVGLSDHSASVYPGLAAAARGADLIEVHVTLSREMFGPDVCASLTTDELRTLVEGVRSIDTMLRNPVDKDEVAQGMGAMRRLFTKSVVALRDLDAGAILGPETLTCKKPGTGLPPDRLKDMYGKRVTRTLKMDEMLKEGDWTE